MWVPNWGQCDGSTLDLNPAPDPYLGCTFRSEFRVHSGSSSGSIYVSLYWYYVNPMLSLEFNILSHNSVPSGQIWKFFHKQGSICIRWTLWVSSTVCYLQNWAFCPIFLLFSILFAVCLLKPYFLLFECNFDSLDRQFGTYCFYVNLETFSDIKLICVPNHCYWSIPFSAVTSPASSSIFVFYFLTWI